MKRGGILQYVLLYIVFILYVVNMPEIFLMKNKGKLIVFGNLIQ